jgi:hypothetical protein
MNSVRHPGNDFYDICTKAATGTTEQMTEEIKSWSTVTHHAHRLECFNGILTRDYGTIVLRAAVVHDRVFVKQKIDILTRVHNADIYGGESMEPYARPLLVGSVYRGNSNAVAGLLDAGVNPNLVYNNYRENLLIYATSNNLDDIVGLLCNKKMLTSTKDMYGDDALAIAARIGSPNIVRILLQANANIDAINPVKGTNALHCALQNKRKTSHVVVDMLLKSGIRAHYHCYRPNKYNGGSQGLGFSPIQLLSDPDSFVMATSDAEKIVMDENARIITQYMRSTNDAWSTNYEWTTESPGGPLDTDDSAFCEEYEPERPGFSTAPVYDGQNPTK